MVETAQTDYNESMDKGKPSAKISGNPSKVSLFNLTLESDEGPYYKSGSPGKTRLFEDGIPGDKLTLSGHVRDVNGNPVSHAWVDFWQADGRGEYDNAGYLLRGHQYTDNAGKYSLETVVPGGYFSRTPHIHVKVRAKIKKLYHDDPAFYPRISIQQSGFPISRRAPDRYERHTGWKNSELRFCGQKSNLPV